MTPGRWATNGFGWCGRCGRHVGTFIPAGGDGTLEYAKKHKGPDGVTCWRIEAHGERPANAVDESKCKRCGGALAWQTGKRSGWVKHPSGCNVKEGS